MPAIAFNMRDQVTTESQDELDWETEQQINLQVQVLHNQIGHKLFTFEVISSIYHQVLNPINSNNIKTDVLNRYINSLQEETKHCFQNELQIFDSTGQVSSYFIRGQELDVSAIDEMSQVVKEWRNMSQIMKGTLSFDKEALSPELLSKFDEFGVRRRIEAWTQENLRELRFTFGRAESGWKTIIGIKEARAVEIRAKQEPISSGAVPGRKISGKRKLSIDSDECPESKRAREFNDLYDATPKRKKHPRVVLESEVDEENTMDLS